MTEVRITIASPPDRDNLVSEVFFDEIQWAELNQEGDELEVEFYSRPDGKAWRLPVELALDALNRAKAALKSGEPPSVI